MKKTLQMVIKSSKGKIDSSFFKIVKTEDEKNPYIIQEYFGPLKSLTTMMKNGWNRHSYLKDFINEDYPVFKLSDFKSTNGFRIEKKTDIDLLKNELERYTEYFKVNNKLYESLKTLKDFLGQFGVANFIKYQTFSDVKNDFMALLNRNMINATDKQKYNAIFIDILNNVYYNLEIINISTPRVFFENKFMYLLSLIK
jgi:hypothetical protein